MFNRKRSLKSNTNDVRVRNVGYANAKKFEELMRRTGKESELEAFVCIIDLLDGELPKVPLGKPIPTHVMNWRKENGFDVIEIQDYGDDLWYFTVEHQELIFMRETLK